MSRVYVASSTTLRLLEASTFCKTIAYPWNAELLIAPAVAPVSAKLFCPQWSRPYCMAQLHLLETLMAASSLPNVNGLRKSSFEADQQHFSFAVKLIIKIHSITFSVNQIFAVLFRKILEDSVVHTLDNLQQWFCYWNQDNLLQWFLSLPNIYIYIIWSKHSGWETFQLISCICWEI